MYFIQLLSACIHYYPRAYVPVSIKPCFRVFCNKKSSTITLSNLFCPCPKTFGRQNRCLLYLEYLLFALLSHHLSHPTTGRCVIPPSTMPHRPGEICERCHKHIHPQTVASTESTHSLPACASCLPPGVILLTCGGCKLTRYCVSLLIVFGDFSPSPYDIDAREELVKKLIDQFIENAARLISG